ncbi:type IV pilus twitching motility protein PilT [Aidingimonas halophila]|uniref:Pilus retraction ATPase PilT n=1 Tax=Aidingimonas halophila TaxID=574349 RepID=A0A1H2YE80_9GAMM|nr:type IV pilus twitching motility protein PilT [Aidingimonas halophila]GHC34891.1 twitching mobility protein [Aidingimonas halophila]SDX03486.1 pilus retraction ATPase PilT [Aidingimonas halophila]
MDITELLAYSAKQNASDLHLSAGLPPMIRVDGDIQRLDKAPMSDGDLRSQVQELMADRQRESLAQHYQCDFMIELPGVARFRANVFTHDRGMGVVFRVIPSQVPTMEELGLGAVFQRLASLPRGLVLVTGPTGSGKSTTLAAMVDYINDTRCEHVLTIEDPIEYLHSCKHCLIHQREVDRDTHGFAPALRSALREDPDVILVGELRDAETVRLALTAAETGHLVLATLHTASAAKTIDRVIDVFPGEEKPMVRSMLSESLQGVISQVLIKRVGGGRVAAHEIMMATPAIRNLIREDRVAQIHSAIQTGKSVGMQTLDMSLEALVSQGVVPREAAHPKAQGMLHG